MRDGPTLCPEWGDVEHVCYYVFLHDIHYTTDKSPSSLLTIMLHLNLKMSEAPPTQFRFYYVRKFEK